MWGQPHSTDNKTSGAISFSPALPKGAPCVPHIPSRHPDIWFSSVSSIWFATASSIVFEQWHEDWRPKGVGDKIVVDKDGKPVIDPVQLAIEQAVKEINDAH